MINNLKVLAIIPARGGSKGVHLKNLRKVNGIPIVELAAKIACQVSLIDRVVVSTDHDEIAKIAKRGGADAPFVRPKGLSGDRIGDLDVLTHALLTMEKVDDTTYDIIVMLQPTSPIRTAKHVSSAIETLAEGDFDSVWTVSESDSKAHPLKQLTIVNGKLDYYDKRGKEVIARQQLKPLYYRNGIAYAITRDCLIDQKSILGTKGVPLILQGHFVSIDTEWDFRLVEFEMKNSIEG